MSYNDEWNFDDCDEEENTNEEETEEEDDEEEEYMQTPEDRIINEAEYNISDMNQQLDDLETDITLPGIIDVLSAYTYNNGNVLTDGIWNFISDSSCDDYYKDLFKSAVSVYCRLEHLTGSSQCDTCIVSTSNATTSPFEAIRLLVYKSKLYSENYLYPYVLHVLSNIDYDVYLHIMRRINEDAQFTLPDIQ